VDPKYGKSLEMATHWVLCLHICKLVTGASRFWKTFEMFVSWMGHSADYSMSLVSEKGQINLKSLPWAATQGEESKLTKTNSVP